MNVFFINIYCSWSEDRTGPPGLTPEFVEPVRCDPNHSMPPCGYTIALQAKQKGDGRKIVVWSRVKDVGENSYHPYIGSLDFSAVFLEENPNYCEPYVNFLQLLHAQNLSLTYFSRFVCT